MEVAGAKEMPEDAERKGLGTPATRAAILEKLVATGFVERKKSKKTVSLIPTHAGISLITVLPEQLQSPLMTAEWEHRLKEIEHGEESPETFMQGIRGMVCELVKTYKTVLGADVLFPSGRAVVGKCPRCGSDVTESKKGYFCERNDCHFGLWRDNRFLAAKKINLTKKMAETLLKDGKTYASGIFSEKTGKTYDAYIVLEDDGTKTAYRLEFERGNFTFDEINLMCIYNTGTRAGLMQALTDMRGQLEPDEAELLELTDSALRKLGRITDEQFAELELVPDFD